MADFVFANKSNSSDFSSTGDRSNEVFGDLLLNRTELETFLTSLRRRQRSATPPTNPNTGDIWECSTTGGGYTADVVYRYNGSAWVEAVASAVNITNRNTVLQGKVDANGNPALFEAGTGLAVKLNATSVNAIFAFMNGNSASVGAVDIVAAITADNAAFWSSLPTSSTVYLYVDYASGTLSGGFTTVAPVYQDYAPAHASGLHWFNFNTGKVYSSDGSAWTQRNRICVGTATTNGSGVTAVQIYPYNAAHKLVANDIITKGPWVDVRAFGAKGDGVTDDTAAIQAAINYAGAEVVDTAYTGGNRPQSMVVFFPDGIYLISTEIFMKSGITIQGSGRSLNSSERQGCRLSLTATNSAIFRYVEGITNTSICDINFECYHRDDWDVNTFAIKFEPADGVYYDDGVFPASSFDHRVKNCTFLGFYQQIAIYRAHKNLTTYSSSDWQVDHLVLDGNSHLYYAKSGIFNHTSNGFDYSTISNSGFTGYPQKTTISSHGIEMERGGFVKISSIAGSNIMPSGAVATDECYKSSLFYTTDYSEVYTIENSQSEGVGYFIRTLGSASSVSITAINCIKNQNILFESRAILNWIGGSGAGKIVIRTSDCRVFGINSTDISCDTDNVSNVISINGDLKSLHGKISGTEFTNTFPQFLNYQSVPSGEVSDLIKLYLGIPAGIYRLKLQYAVTGTPTYSFILYYSTVVGVGTLAAKEIVLASNVDPKAGEIITHEFYAAYIDINNSINLKSFCDTPNSLRYYTILEYVAPMPTSF